jgi:hypothetical protein
MKKYYFLWVFIKTVISEIGKIYSSKSSFFSKKRIESGISFIISQWGMIYWLIKKHHVMTTTDFVMWAGLEFAVAGYIIHQIQKEKYDPTINNVKESSDYQ